MDFNDFNVYNAKDQILGRLASRVAKELLSGKKVAVVNARYAVITGSKGAIVSKYRTRLNLQEKENPEHSPYWSRRPDMLFKRIVRGMLPYRKPHGKSAYKRLRVFQLMPEGLKGFKQEAIESKDLKDIYVNHITLGELSKLLGYEKGNGDING
ncbi:MAG: 50S ribosomal protein L13 [Candidatus Marsarchaeota archaeon]|jgi:large subunit ribosomal protein L13|nr:50S ribosomal protein L13 [Candidatus Marsarchaeota archaeon]MCL5418851.1 50S ribosomal protein L13 [Candidatus Marsarchaeota archaeon]